MNKFCALVFGLNLSGVACAQSEEINAFYLGALIGQAQGEVGATEMNARMASLGYDANARVDGQNRTAWTLYAGYQWNAYLGVELGYRDLGEVETRLTGTAVDINDYLTSANTVHPRSADGYTFALHGRYALTDNAHVFIRGGLFYIRSQYNATGQGQQARRRDEDRQGFWGLGYSHALNEHWELRLSWEHFKVEDENISAWGLGIKYQFRNL